MKRTTDTETPLTDARLPEKVPLALSMQWPLIQLGRSLRNMVRAYHRYFSVSPDDLCAVYQRRARQAEESGDAEGAKYFLEKVVAMSPDDPDALYDLGLTCETTRELDEALACYHKVIDLQAKHVKARFRIGVLHLRKQEFKAAATALEAARKLEPKSADIHFRLGQAYDGMQEHEKALAHFQKAVNSDAAHLPAYKNMALTLDSMGRHKEALQCLKRALELEELSA